MGRLGRCRWPRDDELSLQGAAKPKTESQWGRVLRGTVAAALTDAANFSRGACGPLARWTSPSARSTRGATDAKATYRCSQPMGRLRSAPTARCRGPTTFEARVALTMSRRSDAVEAGGPESGVVCTKTACLRDSRGDLACVRAAAWIKKTSPLSLIASGERGLGVRVFFRYLAVMMKWPRRFCCQQDSDSSLQTGCSLPLLTVWTRSAPMPRLVR